MYSDKTEISLDCNTNRITNLPIGVFKKKLIGNKYVNVIELDKHLLDSSNITEGISDECKFNSSITDDCQLHFTTAASTPLARASCLRPMANSVCS